MSRMTVTGLFLSLLSPAPQSRLGCIAVKISHKASVVYYKETFSPYSSHASSAGQ